MSMEQAFLGTPTTQGAPPATRSRKACDACSIRKIKCDESSPRCKSCVLLDVACTFNRPTRRRGPTSRHFDNLTRQRSQNGPIEALHSTIPAPGYNEGRSDIPSYNPQSLSSAERTSGSQVQSTTVSSSTGHVPETSISADSICDIVPLQILLDDYFTYIHPVIPLPHEPTFRAALARRDDRIDGNFLGQIAAMIEVLAASFPRRPMQIFASAEARTRYPSAGALIDKCHEVLNYTRGIDFMDREPNLTDALCSYLAGLSAGYTFRMARQRRYMAECILMLRTLGFHQPEATPTVESSKTVDHIYKQSGRRLFWLCFVGTMSMRQLGGYDSDILIPPTAYTESLPPLPLEVDDEYIYSSTILRQPAGVTSRLVGFNINVRIFRAFHRLTALEMLFGKDTVYDWNRQRHIIASALQDVKEITSHVPKELQLLLFHEQGSWQPRSTSDFGLAEETAFHAINSTRAQHQSNFGSTPQKYTIQFEIQKANIYATQLATRSYLVEKFWNLYEIHDRSVESPAMSTAGISALFSPQATADAHNVEAESTRNDLDSREASEHLMAVEREAIVRDMALLLKNINRVNMEPNGISLCNKIRQVASTLLSQDRYRMSRMPNLDPETVNNYLYGFCDILAKLERLGNSGNGAGVGSVSASHSLENSEQNIDPNTSYSGNTFTAQEFEDEQLAHWASLKEHQERFIRMNGFLDTL